ncbi:MAG: DUF4175 family protein, partial [Parvularculaceae bacterium]
MSDAPTIENRKRRRPPGGLRRGLAGLFLVAERLAPVVLVGLAPLALVSVAALFGAWRSAPALAHWIALGLAALATGLGVVWAWRRTRADASPVWPPARLARAARARLERDGAVRFGAVNALADKPFDASDVDGAGDPISKSLWRAHQSAMRAEAARAQLALPRVRFASVDPRGVRYAVLALAALGLAVAGSDAPTRLAGAFAPGDPLGRPAGVADLWIEPPAYTGVAPIYLLRAGEAVAGERQTTFVPAGARVVAIGDGVRRLRLSYAGTSQTLRAPADKATPNRRALTVSENGVLNLKVGGAVGRWPIDVSPDLPPAIRFLETPAPVLGGPERAGIAMRVDIVDDYGLETARFVMRLDPDQTRPRDAPAIDAAALAETREIPLPVARGARGERRFDLDLEADPWAGLAVLARGEGVDGAGQSASTEPAAIRLPSRAFYDPLARAVVEQRRDLAVAPSQWRRAATAFNGLTLGPEAFFDRPSDYLMLRAALWRLTGAHRPAAGDDARTDEPRLASLNPPTDLSDFVADLWPLALQLENKRLSDARARLDAAKDALRDALERGASEAELERLTENLRAAMRDYIAALASNPTEPRGDAPEGQTLSADELERMLDDVRDLAASGAASAAQRALDDLENILNNLNFAGAAPSEGQQGAAGGQQAGQSAAGAAGDLIARQRDLSNETFSRGRDQADAAPGAPGQSGAGGAAADDLAQAQNDLAGDLSDLLSSLPQPGNAGPGAPQEGGQANGGQAGGGEAARLGEAARDALRDALGEMGQAESALEGENFAAANGAMERAIQSLREGAEALARREGAERAANAGAGGQGPGAPGPGRDPLG